MEISGGLPESRRFGFKGEDVSVAVANSETAVPIGSSHDIMEGDGVAA